LKYNQEMLPATCQLLHKLIDTETYVKFFMLYRYRYKDMNIYLHSHSSEEIIKLLTLLFLNLNMYQCNHFLQK